MSKTEQKKFIRDLCNCVRDELIKVASDFPKTWDGHELRLLIAERFESAASMSAVRKNKRLMAAYKNSVLVCNL